MKFYIYAVLAVFLGAYMVGCPGGSSSVTYKSICQDACTAPDPCSSDDDDDDDDNDDNDVDSCVDDCVDSAEESDPDGDCVSEYKKVYDCADDFGCIETYEDLQDFEDECGDDIDSYNECIADLEGDDDDDNDDDNNDSD